MGYLRHTNLDLHWTGIYLQQFLNTFKQSSDSSILPVSTVKCSFILKLNNNQRCFYLANCFGFSTIISSIDLPEATSSYIFYNK